MAYDIELERMTGASPVPAPRPGVEFLVTLSFLLTTPGARSPTGPFGGFLLEDVVLFGAALYTAAEALEAAS